MKNNSQFKSNFVLLYNNLGFSICYLFEYFSGQEWNKTLSDAYVYGRELEEIYENRRKQKTFIVFIRYITYYSLIFFVHKQVWEDEKNEWKMELYSRVLYVYGILYSRLKSLQVRIDSRLSNFAHKN